MSGLSRTTPAGFQLRSDSFPVAQRDTVNKLSLAAVSLVAAIPGGVLAVLMALVFLRHAEHMKTNLLILAGLTLAVSALVTVMPLGILIFGSKGKQKTETVKDKPDDGDGDDSGDGQEQDSFAESDELELSDSDAELALAEGDEDLEMADDDDFGFSDDDFDMEDEDTDEKS